MKIVFLHYGREHLGIEYLSASLKKQGYDVALVCDPGLFSSEDNIFYSKLLKKIFQKKNLIKEVLSQKPDLIAFSAYTQTYQWCCKMAAELKKKSAAKILFGGIHPTLCPKEVLSNPSIDFIIRGEGEESFLALMHALTSKTSLSLIPNLGYKQQNELILNEMQFPMESLDTLPLPDKAIFEKSTHHGDDYMIMSHRGCPHNCSYCAESFLNELYAGAYLRRRSVDSIIEELKIMKNKYDFKRVTFFDSIFFINKKWLESLLEQYRIKINVPFKCCGHVNFFDKEVAELLKKGGCYNVNFGIQSFNPQIRSEFLCREESNQQIKESLEICETIQLAYDIDLIFDLPGSTRKDHELALSYLKNSKYLNRIKCFYLTYYPNLQMTEKAKKDNILTEEDIHAIDNGLKGSWFHPNLRQKSQTNKGETAFLKLFKIYPGLPCSLRAYVIKKQKYAFFSYIPTILIMFFQLGIGLIKKDYRFHFYINKYMRKLLKKS